MIPSSKIETRDLSPQVLGGVAQEDSVQTVITKLNEMESSGNGNNQRCIASNTVQNTIYATTTNFSPPTEAELDCVIIARYKSEYEGSIQLRISYTSTGYGDLYLYSLDNFISLHSEDAQDYLSVILDSPVNTWFGEYYVTLPRYLETQGLYDGNFQFNSVIPVQKGTEIVVVLKTDGETISIRNLQILYDIEEV